MKSWFEKHTQLTLIILISMIVTFVYRFPDVYAYLTTPVGMVFLGQNSWFDPADVNVYVSIIHYGQLGHLLLPNIWSALPSQPIIFFPVELILGFLFRSLNPYLLFWLSSIVTGIMLISGIFLLVKKSGLPHLLTAATTLGIALGGGFGFFLYPNVDSADIISRLTFYEPFLKSHEAIAFFCYLSALVLFFEIVTQKTKPHLRKVIVIALNVIIFMLIYPYEIVSYTLITLSFFLHYKIKIPKTYLAIIFIPAVFMALFIYWQFSFNQGFYQLLKIHLPTQPLPTFLGYGILLPIFCYQLFFLKKTPFMGFLSIWILVTISLALLPFGPGKVILQGLFFPLVLLAVLQIKDSINKITYPSLKLACWTVFFALICATNISLIFLRDYAVHTEQATNIFYMQQEDFKIFSYLNNHTPVDSGVITTNSTNDILSAFTHNRGVVGSMEANIPEYSQGLTAINLFYAGRPVAKDYLAKNHVSYVLWGPTEQEITNTSTRGDIITDLSKIYPNLKLVYETKTTKLYKVTPILTH